MKTFSIKELETLCDVKAHTIRVWEKRYGVFQPERNSANARRYTTDDLAKLLGFVLLKKNGYKISAVAPLAPAVMQQQISGLTQPDERIQRAVHDLIVCMYSLNVSGFENVLDTAFLSLPADAVVQQIIYPFLEKTGLLCQGKRLSEEHFAVTAVRKKLYWSIQRTVANKKKEKTVVLFLNGERQLDLLLLYAYYLLEAGGWNVIHLGGDVSVKNIEEFLRLQPVDYLMTYFVRKPGFSVWDLSGAMKTLAPEAMLVVLKSAHCFSVESSGNVLLMDAGPELEAFAKQQEAETAAKDSSRLLLAL